MMKIGVRIPCFRNWVHGDEVRSLAVRAEELGFDSIWVHDHLVAPVSSEDDVIPLSGWLGGSGEPQRSVSAKEYYAGDDWWLDPYAMWGFIAGATTRVELASDIIVVPYRNPIVQAKLLGTLDVLSKGRMILGVGAGHVESESRVLGISAEEYAARGDVTDEYLRIIRDLLTKEETGFEGKHYRFEPVRPLISPVRKPHPPFWMGGHGKRALRRAVELGQAWLPSNLSPDELRHGAQVLREMSATAGRETPPELALARRLKLEDPAAPAPSGRRPALNPGQAAALLDEYAAIGVVHISLDLPNPNYDVLLRQMEIFARDVRPLVTSAA